MPGGYTNKYLHLLRMTLQDFPIFLTYVANKRLRMISQKPLRATFHLHTWTTWTWQEKIWCSLCQNVIKPPWLGTLVEAQEQGKEQQWYMMLYAKQNGQVRAITSVLLHMIVFSSPKQTRKVHSSWKFFNNSWSQLVLNMSG